MRRAKIFDGKKGAEKTISVYWFAILIIVAGAIVYIIGAVYGEPYDIRSIEAEILAGNIADCVSEGGYLTGAVLDDSFQDNFLEICNLNLNATDFPQSRGEYYVEVGFYDFNTGDKIKDVFYGNTNLKQYCELTGNSLPSCSQKIFYAVSESQQGYRIDILAVVNKADKNI